MTHDLFVKMCQLYYLGDLIGDPEPVKCGLLNFMWKITTQKGSFAIKVMHPHQKRSEQDYIISEKIATIMALHGIPAIPALTLGGQTVQTINDLKVLIFDWVEGKTLLPDPAPVQQAKIMGTQFAKMHLLKLQLPELTASAHHYIGQEKWQHLAKIATEKKISFADKLLSNIDQLLAWESLYQQSKLALGRYELASHRDLNPKNIIWINSTSPKIIDWEWAGLINPDMEALSAALEWSGLLSLQFSASSYKAFLQGYYQAGAKISVDPINALHNSLGKWLDWLAFNIELVSFSTNPAEHQSQITEIEHVFNLLEFLMLHLTQFAKLALEIHMKYYSTL